MRFFLATVLVGTVLSYCPSCNQGVRYVQYSNGSPVQKRYSFNFDEFFKRGEFSNNRFHSYGSPRQPSRIFNAYGQDAETFGSAIGKSIAQRILQVYGQQQDPSTTSTTSGASPISTTSLSSLSPSPSPSSPSYDIQFTPTSTTYGTSPSSPSTHPPEDLPTVQQAYQQSLSLSTPSLINYQSNINGFGGLPGLLPPPGQNNGDFTNCPWCTGQNGGFRNKRGPSDEEKGADN